MIQHVYSENNIEKLFISPYCLFRIEENKLEMFSSNQKEIICLYILNPQKIIYNLENGIFANHLIYLLQEEVNCSFEKAIKLLKLLIQKKIIE